MADQYHIDTEKYSLQKVKKDLESREMIPSRVILKVELDERFRVLELQGITNLKELISALNTKPKLVAFANDTGLSVEYLTLLRREANSYLPNPVRLDRFPGIPSTDVERLSTEGIKNSKHLLHCARTKREIDSLSQRTTTPVNTLVELVCLSDLVRTYGVGPVFARMFYDIGIKTIKDLNRCSAEAVISKYEEQEGRKADFSANEIQFSLNLAKELDILVDL